MLFKHTHSVVNHFCLWNTNMIIREHNQDVLKTMHLLGSPSRSTFNRTMFRPTSNSHYSQYLEDLYILCNQKMSVQRSTYNLVHTYYESYNLFCRFSQEASKKQRIIDFCQEAGIVEILPYHECDITSQGQTDYLFCLTNLQIVKESFRFPVFITGESFVF